MQQSISYSRLGHFYITLSIFSSHHHQYLASLTTTYNHQHPIVHKHNTKEQPPPTATHTPPPTFQSCSSQPWYLRSPSSPSPAQRPAAVGRVEIMQLVCPVSSLVASPFLRSPDTRPLCAARCADWDVHQLLLCVISRFEISTFAVPCPVCALFSISALLLRIYLLYYGLHMVIVRPR